MSRARISRALWADIRALLQATPALRHDIIVLTKMPAKVGAQDNPLLGLDVRLNPSGAYETALGTNWEQFYTGKRSSATRRRDRTKLKKLGDLGAVKFVDPDAQSEIDATLDVLMVQKSKSFARMGVPNMFARPGHTDFYRALAATRSLAHLSRLDVGAHVGGGQSRAHVPRLLLPRARELRRRRGLALRPGRRASARAAALRDRARHEALRLHHRRRALQARLVRDRAAAFDYSAAVTLRGWPSAALSLGWRRMKRAIKQTAPLWNAAQRVRSTIASLRKKPAPAPATKDEAE